jgi:hypothetical protein
MSKLGQVVEAVEKYNTFVLNQVKRARSEEKFARDLLGRWNDIKAKIPATRTPTGLPLPRLALRCRRSMSRAKLLVIFSAKDCPESFHF